MEKGQGKDSKPEVDHELLKYRRFQEIGLSFILAWPVGIMLLAMYGFDYIIPQVSVLVLAIGSILLSIGSTGRREIKERREKE